MKNHLLSMKKFIFISILFYRVFIPDGLSSALSPLSVKLIPDPQTPFNFTNQIPSRIGLAGKVDLSFYVNHSVVFQYRYRLEVPQGGGTNINRTLLYWTDWINKDINEVVVQDIGKEGRYKLVVEYRTHTSNEIKRFEKLFDVYDTRPAIADETAPKKTVPAPAETTPETTKPVAENKPLKNGDDQVKTTTIIKKDDHKQVIEKPVFQNDQTGREVADNRSGILHEKSAVADKGLTKDYNMTLMESIRQKDAGMVKESIRNGAGLGIRGINGGNIFHMLDESTADENLISLLVSKGISINEPDNFNNTPLHYAIIKGRTLYARYLLNQGASLDLKNDIDLAPLHMATMLNNNTIVQDLLRNGANVNIKGNSGYTPLHIASEMNHSAIAGDLLRNGAKARMRTDQKYSSITIAKIQKVESMRKLIASNGYYQIAVSTTSLSSAGMNPYNVYPEIDFNLPYDPLLVRNRQTAKIIQLISAPVFALCAAGAAYSKLEADDYYSLYLKYKELEGSHDIAKSNYNKTLEYDTYFYISGGISVVSLYSFIHSTLWKRNVTNRMHKVFK